MKTILHHITLLLVLLVSVGCVKEIATEEMTPQQQSLIDHAVNFNVSVSDRFVTRLNNYSYEVNGTFNIHDRMRIYRNYWDSRTGGWSSQEAYRTYNFQRKTIADLIELERLWLPEAGQKGCDEGGVPFSQSKADSLVWQNGSTVRFRAWSQSNFANILNSQNRNRVYPDFCIADFVTASGPTSGIPLVLKHVGARIVVKPKGGSYSYGNQIRAVEISIDWRDYKYADNANVNANDNSSTEATKTDAEAQAECNSVIAAYNRMCMPAGVDIASGMLKAYDKTKWDSLTDSQVRTLQDDAALAPYFVTYGMKTPSQIASDVKRPFFSVIEEVAYMISIPYDLSNDAETQGEIITLPACTRFRVYLRDVNGVNVSGVDGVEGAYHILSLADVKDGDAPVYPNGLKLDAGASYIFEVGYQYGNFTVSTDGNLSWIQQDLGTLDAADEVNPMPGNPEPYKWWKDAIHAAIPTGTGDFNPSFEISNAAEFLEFINLVNGTATDRTSGLYRFVKEYDMAGKPVYGWSTVNDTDHPNWITESEAEDYGYIFYDRYYPANADRPAYSDRDYLRGPYSFYNDNLKRNFKVSLTSDLDLEDWQIQAIGNGESCKFMGNFDGGMHTIRNVNVTGGYLFKYMDGKAVGGASITNLAIDTIHDFCLLKHCVNPIFIAGISIKANSSGNSIAETLTNDDGVTGPSFVVGCIHVGKAGGALVGTAANMNMFGCMQAASGIPGSSGTLLGSYEDAGNKFLAPQISLAGQKAGRSTSERPVFRRFMCNYYDKELSPGTRAVGTIADDYSLLEYIRGAASYVLKAKNDYMLKDMPMDRLVNMSYEQYYGLAPWHAMNYAIYRYNADWGSEHRCLSHYEVSSVGYNNRYPHLVSGDPVSVYTEPVVKKWDPISQDN